MQRHVICRQVVDVTVHGSEMQAMDVQRDLSNACANILPRILEDAFSRHVPPGEHWYLDRLDIDAGSIAALGLEKGVAVAVSDAVEAVLRNLASGGMRSNPQIHRRSASQAIWEALLYFLAEGHLPWWYQVPAGSDLQSEVSAALEHEDKGTAMPVPLTEAARVLRVPPARRRLVRQFRPEFLVRLLDRLIPVESAIRPQLAALRADTGLAGRIERDVWEQWFGQWSRQGDISAPVKGIPSLNVGADAGATGVDGEREDSVESTRHEAGGASTADPDARGTRQRESPRSGLTRQEDSPEPAAQGGIYVEDAGLVLLHPFLPRLFETLGWAEGTLLTSTERAMTLLHYLSTGFRSAPEYTLVLPKLLCEVPQDASTDADLRVSDEEAEEADRLLGAVISHWSALGSTSVEGLRGSFLVRPGHLQQREDGDWTLRVEPRSYDILMDQLPWGISAIRLPWMSRMLWVEWH